MNTYVVHATTSDRTRAEEIAERVRREEKRAAIVANVSDLFNSPRTRHTLAVLAEAEPYHHVV